MSFIVYFDQEILDSKVVGAVITDVAGMSAEEIKDLVNTLNGTDADLVKGLSSIAQFVADYVDCIDLDRFEGFETEQAMNEEAARLHGSNSLMAGRVFHVFHNTCCIWLGTTSQNSCNFLNPFSNDRF